jgi:hypothetical protein
MKSIIYLFKYGLVDDTVLKGLTKENWKSVIAKTDVKPEIGDIYRGDQILCKLEDPIEIRACLRDYKATNFDGMIANQIANGLIEKPYTEYYSHILCPHKIGKALKVCQMSGVLVDEICIDTDFIIPAIEEDYEYAEVRFTDYKQLTCNRGKRYNPNAYTTASGTDVSIIHEVNCRYRVDKQDQSILFVNAVYALNVELANMCYELMDKRYAETTGSGKDLMICAMMSGDELLIDRVSKLVKIHPTEYVDFAGNLLTAMVNKSDKGTVLQACANAAYLADLDLLEYYLQDVPVEMTKIFYCIACGAACGGHGSLLDTSLAILSQLGNFEKNNMQTLMEFAYCFDNYHCIAILTKYDKRLGFGAKVGDVTLLGGVYIGNLQVPNPPRKPEYFDDWFASYYTDCV